ncbi:Nucleoside-diphosphate-sugar pyrophosphorylase family protein [Halogeometricum borinquense DSM 11551]|uniref:Bifunctional protein GlmU n=2 Tax=Halogeometricum borinquense TaxID=60847 RepID=E4NWD8_HALBP|nr:bifunctional sugar-1-phosphate nucleotidylyltransferase/acetyltransferase [Halogeometricum borinquense]ADQ69358.1 Nucleoside-diphosphate-sugar pyrophosphorylase family protein [Halogeometricum borinquense DSM 11551]ELY26247.1 Nucleoside-diphosphate-sugar pyrophosphorylase family protein [Halogeometricum borinquense DSM 11551]RYJ19560.1 glucose-1-phosphate thymidylyltransferase [Halogeometricum borinquense]
MQTVVLAAGVGSRMWPLTASRPKPMLPVAGKPLVAHTVDAAVEAGATEIVLVVGYEADDVRSFFGTEYAGVPVEYAVQAEQLGTADAVRSALEVLEDGSFAVLNGDALYDVPSLTNLYDGGPAVGSFEVEDPTSYGVLKTDGSGYVAGVVEKPSNPPSNLINAGAYVFPEAAHGWLLDVEASERGELELTDVLSRSCETYDVRTVAFDRWLDVGRPWELLEANEWKLSELETRIDGDVSEDAELNGPVVVEEGAKVRSGVVIDGPALIQSGASVGPNAYVRGATLICEDAKVGHAVEVKNSVLMEDATVGHLAYVGDSVLGRNVNFGAGTNVANLRHDGANVKLTVKDTRVDTGRRKLGVVIGDGAKTGINSSLNAGVVLSPEATVMPGESVTRDR